MIRILILTFLVLPFYPGVGQNRLLDNPEILDEIKVCISSTYNFRFDKARNCLQKVQEYSPDHPATSFLEAFIIYWEYYPLIPGHEKEEEFLKIMDNCIRNSEEWVKKEEAELEAIFFDLFSRAFYVMYWADNGKPGKVFPHLNILYKHTMEGFELKEKFNEFYFTTGLYNYYVEAYPEKHPAYKPIVMLFREGNKPVGLRQMKYCAKNAIFLRVEATFFLSLLYLNYEENLDRASEYAAKLYREFPYNTFYAGKYLEILLFNRKYFFAPVILQKLQNWKDPFSRMQYYLYNGYYLEKANKDYPGARKNYIRALEISQQFKDFTNSYNAIAYMGLGRLEKRNGNSSEANRYFRLAKNASSYDYILKDR